MILPPPLTRQDFFTRRTMVPSQRGNSMPEAPMAWVERVSASQLLNQLQPPSTFSSGSTISWQAHTSAPGLKLDPINRAQFPDNILRTCIYCLTFKTQSELVASYFWYYIKVRIKMMRKPRFVLKIKLHVFVTQNFFYLRYACLFLFHDSSIAIYNKFYNRENFS